MNKMWAAHFCFGELLMKLQYYTTWVNKVCNLTWFKLWTQQQSRPECCRFPIAAAAQNRFRSQSHPL